jgi:hypothetical protein
VVGQKRPGRGPGFGPGKSGRLLTFFGPPSDFYDHFCHFHRPPLLTDWATMMVVLKRIAVVVNS